MQHAIKLNICPIVLYLWYCFYNFLGDSGCPEPKFRLERFIWAVSYAYHYVRFLKIHLSLSDREKFGVWVGWIKSRLRCLLVKVWCWIALKFAYSVTLYFLYEYTISCFTWNTNFHTWQFSWGFVIPTLQNTLMLCCTLRCFSGDWRLVEVIRSMLKQSRKSLQRKSTLAVKVP